MTLVPPQTFRKTDGIHRVGLLAARPAAADVLTGTLYFSTDTGALERSNGTAWAAYAGAAPALPYLDLVEGTFQNPPADTERLYALDVNGYTQVEMKDSAGHGARLASDNLLIAKITEPNGVSRGQIVYIAGASGANPLVRLAKSDAIATMPTIGVVLDPGAVNAFTRVLTSGTLQGVNTAAFTEGVSLFTSPTTAGALTDVFPAYPNYAQRVGFVTRSHATQGELLVMTTGTVTDPRLHHTTHEPGGSDALVNAAWTNVANTFGHTQTIQPGAADGDSVALHLNGTTGEGGVLVLTDLTAPANQRTYYVKSQAGSFTIQTTTDIGTTAGAVQIYQGALYLRTPFPPQIVMSNLTDSVPDYPRLVGGSGQMEFKRFDNTDRILVLAKGFGDTPLDASQLLTGTVPVARLPTLPPTTPTAHHTTHEPGGSDALVNVAWTTVANTFTQPQAITGTLGVSGAITGATDWVNLPFNAANFTGGGSMTWTVTAGNITTLAYTLIKKTMTVCFAVVGTTLGGTVSNTVNIVLPGFITNRTLLAATAMLSNGGVFLNGYVICVAGQNFLQFAKVAGGNFVADADFRVYGQMILEVQ